MGIHSEYGNFLHDHITWTCNNPGLPDSSCSSDTFEMLIEMCIEDDVCENWSVDGFLEHLENAILEINEEIYNDED